MNLLEHTCEACGGAGWFTLTQPRAESPERDRCEECDGAGVEVAGLQAAYRGAVEAAQPLVRALELLGTAHKRSDERLPSVCIAREALAEYRALGGQ